MSTVPPIQDMPPQGGYSKINYARVPAKKVFTGAKVIAAYLLMQGAAVYYHTRVFLPNKRLHQIEKRSAEIALKPFLLAERDRARMIRLIDNREIETELMKDVEGWEVGTLMGEPIYKTIGKDDWVSPLQLEYFTHADKGDLDIQNNFRYMY